MCVITPFFVKARTCHVTLWPACFLTQNTTSSSQRPFVATPEFGQSTRWLSMIYHLEKLTQKEITPSLAMVHSFGRWVIPYSTVLSRTDSISHHLMSYRKVRLTQSEFRFLLMWFIYSTRIPERLCTKVCPEIARPPWNTRGVLT